MKKLFYLLLIITFSASCSIEEESEDYGETEGSPTSPVTLTLGTAHSGKVAKWDYSYYSFTTSSTGAGTYELAATSLAITDSRDSTKSIGIEAYTSQGSPNTSSVNNGLLEYLLADGTAYFGYKNANASTTYYIRIYGFGLGTYTLTLSKGGSEGSVSNPVELTLGTAHSGTVEGYESDSSVEGYESDSSNGNSFYKFTTSGADNYTLTMTNSDSLDCYLYSNSNLSSSSLVDGCTEGANLSGTFNGSNGTGLSESTTYYLEIEQQATSSAPKTTTYNITVAAEGN